MNKNIVSLSIHKVKLKDASKLEVEYEKRTEIQDDSGAIIECFKDEVSLKSERHVHPDLEKAFKILNIHLAFICELVDPYDLELEDSIHDFVQLPESADHEYLKSFLVTGFTIGGEGDHEGVVLTGRKVLKSQKILNINTPFQKFIPGEFDEGVYDYLDQLRWAIDNVINEVNLFIIEGKSASNGQLELFDAA